ncbi:MAG: asparagine synthase-related protein [Dokdonia sp.]|jgi:asparagine synthase (glutamine-hydrolysing)
MKSFSLYIDLQAFKHCKQQVFTPVVPQAEDLERQITFEGGQLNYEIEPRFKTVEGIAIAQEQLSFINGMIYQFDNTVVKPEGLQEVHDVLQSKTENVSLCKGDFSGFVLKASSAALFSNKTNSKPIFYYTSDTHLICASNVMAIAQILKAKGVPFDLDREAAYSLLSFGYILGDRTLIKGVSRLAAATILKLDGTAITTQQYHQFHTTANTSQSECDFIEQLDQTFTKAIHNEFGRDQDLSLKHMTTISGGMDSRMVLAYAHQLGYTDQTAITFSQSHHAEHSIAQKVSQFYQAQFKFYPLDGGDYLRNIDQPIAYNGGSCVYAGACHTLAMLKELDFEHYGILHTGQLGDAVLGTYLSGPKHETAAMGRSLSPHELSGKIQPYIQQQFDASQNHELFKLYNKGFNEIFNGYRMIEQFTPFASAFMDEDFIQLSLTIPPHLKYDRKLYYKWMNAKVPSATQIKLASTNVKPKMKYLQTPYSWIPKFNAYLNLAKYALLPGHVVSMNPFKKWFSENKELANYIYQYGQDHLQYIAHDQELRDDCKKMLQQGFSDQFKAISLLSAVKQIWN